MHRGARHGHGARRPDRDGGAGGCAWHIESGVAARPRGSQGERGPRGGGVWAGGAAQGAWAAGGGGDGGQCAAALAQSAGGRAAWGWGRATLRAGYANILGGNVLSRGRELVWVQRHDSARVPSTPCGGQGQARRCAAVARAPAACLSVARRRRPLLVRTRSHECVRRLLGAGACQRRHAATLPRACGLTPKHGARGLDLHGDVGHVASCSAPARGGRLVSPTLAAWHAPQPRARPAARSPCYGASSAHAHERHARCGRRVACRLRRGTGRRVGLCARAAPRAAGVGRAEHRRVARRGQRGWTSCSSSIWPWGRERDGLCWYRALCRTFALTPYHHNPLGPGNCVQYVCHHRRSRWPGSSGCILAC